MTWTCKNCSEQVEDSFDVCWNCGADVEGNVDPDFVTADAAPEQARPLDQTRGGKLILWISSYLVALFVLPALIGIFILGPGERDFALACLCVVSNIVFGFLMLTILVALFGQGSWRAFAGGAAVGLIGYLIAAVVEVFLLGGIESLGGDSDAILLTTGILEAVVSGTKHEMPRHTYFALFLTGQQLWGVLIGLAAGCVASRIKSRRANR